MKRLLKEVIDAYKTIFLYGIYKWRKPLSAKNENTPNKLHKSPNADIDNIANIEPNVDKFEYKAFIHPEVISYLDIDLGEDRDRLLRLIPPKIDSSFTTQDIRITVRKG